MSATITLFCGALYLNSVSVDLKAFLFIFIVATNIHFSIIWAFYFIELFINIHFTKILSVSPTFLAIFYSFFKTLRIIRGKIKLKNALFLIKDFYHDFKQEYKKMKFDLVGIKEKRRRKTAALSNAVIMKI